MKRIWCISDMHCQYELLKIPENIDIVIVAGDATTAKDKTRNLIEMEAFLRWFNGLSIPTKIYVPGNHDTSLEGFKIDIPFDIIYLEHKYVEVDGLKIFGSPYTPTFGTGWAFNKSRVKIGRYWDQIPNDLDILITHGPPKGILDATNSYERKIEQIGDSALLKAVKVKKPKYHIFGHSHNESGIYNSGVVNLSGIDTTFINASVVDVGHYKFNDGKIIKL